MKKTYYVRAVWDPEVRTYYTESDIRGLAIETPSLEEFEELVFELGPELIMANHMTKQDLSDTPLRDLVPTIIWQKPLAAVS